MTKDGLRPIVPFNTSDLCEYIESKVRDIRHDRYDQFMDHAEVSHFGRGPFAASACRSTVFAG